MLDRSTRQDQSHEDVAALLRNAAATMDDDERSRQIRKVFDAKEALSEEQKQGVVTTLITSLLRLDDAAAKRVAASYQSLLDAGAGDFAFQQTALIQTAAHDLPVEDGERLRNLLPNVFGDKPAEESVKTPGPQEPAEGYPEKRWSTFWEREKRD
jgi:hypothetical protein